MSKSKENPLGGGELDTSLAKLDAVIAKAAIGADVTEELGRSVETFDSGVGSDPLREDYRAIGATAHDTFDGTDKAVEAMAISERIYRTMWKEKELHPKSFKRKRIVHKVQ